MANSVRLPYEAFLPLAQELMRRHPPRDFVCLAAATKWLYEYCIRVAKETSSLRRPYGLRGVKPEGLLQELLIRLTCYCGRQGWTDECLCKVTADCCGRRLPYAMTYNIQSVRICTFPCADECSFCREKVVNPYIYTNCPRSTVVGRCRHKDCFIANYTRLTRGLLADSLETFEYNPYCRTLDSCARDSRVEYEECFLSPRFSHLYELFSASAVEIAACAYSLPLRLRLRGYKSVIDFIEDCDPNNPLLLSTL